MSKYKQQRGERVTNWSLAQAVDGGADFEGGTQLDVHGGDEMVLAEEQQSLPVDFLGQEVSGQLLAAWTTTQGFKKTKKMKIDIFS